MGIAESNIDKRMEIVLLMGSLSLEGQAELLVKAWSMRNRVAGKLLAAGTTLMLMAAVVAIVQQSDDPLTGVYITVGLLVGAALMVVGWLWTHIL